MPAAERNSRDERQKERRAKAVRRFFALCSPRPPLLRGFTKERVFLFFQKTKPSDGDFVAAVGGRIADAFFGASPVVASALAQLPRFSDRTTEE